MSELDPEGEEYRQVADRFERADSEFRARDGYALEAQVGAVLAGLGFSQGRLAAANGRIFGRLADADCAGQTAARKA